MNRRPFNHGCLGLDGRPQHRCRRHALAVSRRAWTLQQDGDVPGAVCQGRHMLHCWAVTRSVTILESRAVLVVPWCSARALVPHVLPPRDELFVAFQKPLAASTDQPSTGPRQVKLRYFFFSLNLATVRYLALGLAALGLRVVPRQAGRGRTCVRGQQFGGDECVGHRARQALCAMGLVDRAGL